MSVLKSERPGPAELPAIASLALMLASGISGLAWQFVWTQQLAASLGHEIVAVLAVLAAFFGGLAVGAWALRRVVERSSRPLLWYAALELAIAAWGLGLSAGLPLLAPLAGELVGARPTPLRHWFVAFALPLLLLLPVTAAMGATLPALERALRSARSSLPALYAANTLGAVAGVLAVVFAAIPAWGLQRTAWACAALNAGCALAARLLWRPRGAEAVVAAAPTAEPAERPRARLALLLAGSGALGIGYEVLAVRVLSQVNENTVYSYALLLAVYLTGTALGAALYQRAQRRIDERSEATGRLIGGLALSVLVGGATLWWADATAGWPARAFGPAAASMLAGEALAALLAMGLPTVAMGALFSHLCRLALAGGWTLGGALALNTAAAALAPLLVGVGLIPLLGPHGVLLLLVAAYLLLIPARRGRSFWIALVALALAAVVVPPLRFVELPPGGRLLSYRDGVMAAVSVVEDGQGVARLRINNRAQEGSSASGAIEMRMALVPLLLHPQPAHALFLGLGTGYTAQLAAADPALDVEAVELLPEVIAAASHFERSPGALPGVGRAHLIAADARRYALASRQRYDVIVSDLFHPARSGAGALYTVEHFRALRQRLAPGGLFCQWLALHQMELGTLRSIVAAFNAVYPDAVAVLAGNSLDTPVLGLIARPDRPRFDPAELQARLDAQAARPELAKAGVDELVALLGSVVAGPRALREFAAGAEVNSDDRPLVSHRAPWDTYAPELGPRQRLAALLAELDASPRELLQPLPAGFDARLSRYWSARREYLKVGSAVVPDPDPARMLQQIEQPLLGVLRISPDFRPAAEPLLALAAALQRSDPQRAATLRRDVMQLSGADPE